MIGLYAGYKRQDDSKNKVHIKTTSNVDLENRSEFIKKMYTNYLLKSPCNKMYKLSILNEHNIRFSPNISLGEDYRFNLTYLRYSKKYTFIEDILYMYNRKSTGLSSKYTPDRLYVKLDNWRYHKNILLEEKMDDLEYLYKEYIIICLSGIADFSKQKNKKELIYKYMKDDRITEELKEITIKSMSSKLKIMAKILNIKVYWIIIMLGKFAMLYKNITN